nr:ATP synthase subunit B 1 like [Ipomoea batatas]
MSVASQNLLTAPHSHSRIGSFRYYQQARLKRPRDAISLAPKPFAANPLQQLGIHFLNWDFPGTRRWHAVNVKAFESDATERGKTLPDYEFNFNFDAFLSVLEFICLASSAAVSIALACVVLVGGMAIGAVIRRRQWRRICNAEFSRPGGGQGSTAGVNLVERIEKLEEDMRSSTTIIRVLSRQLEKLGTRFRVTRRNLKDPITETAALAQKNSEATRELAVQGEVLEKELGEIQKVLLAMQDQQQKQLELILAIGKTSKLWDNKQGPSQDHSENRNAPNTTSSAVDGAPKMRLNQTQTLTGHKEAMNEQVSGRPRVIGAIFPAVLIVAIENDGSNNLQPRMLLEAFIDGNSPASPNVQYFKLAATLNYLVHALCSDEHVADLELLELRHRSGNRVRFVVLLNLLDDL